jgi:hypothetical protein
MAQTIDPDSPAAEQARTVHHKHVTPALKQAIKDAQGSGFSDGAILNGMAAAYGDFLVMTLGRAKAADLLAAQAEHLRETPAQGNGAS